jgi:branched-chain amino acid transport system substrate-binding protein
MINLQGRTVLSAILLAAAAPLSAFAQDEIKIGVLTPLSGNFASIGTTVRNGIDLAVEEINGAGGVLGKPIKLIYEDSEGTPAVAVQKAERLFQVDNVDFLTGTVHSGATLAVGQLAEQNHKLMATSVSFSDAITGEKCSPNVFRVNGSSQQQANVLTAWLAQTMPDARVTIVAPDYEMGRSTTASFEAGAKLNHVEIVKDIYVPLDTKDYSPFFGQIREGNPNVIFAPMAGTDTVRLLTQMQEFGLLENMRLLGAAGTINAQNMDAVGAAGNGMVSGAAYSSLIDTPENKVFVDSYTAKFGEAPDLFAADSYGLIYAYKLAAEAAGNVSTDGVRTGLEGLSWQTPQGVKTIRAGDHQAIMPMYAIEYRDGKFNVLDKVDGEKVIGPDVCERF